MRVRRIVIPFLLVLAGTLICKEAWRTVHAQRVPQTPAEQWLLLSAEAKNEYVHGYLFGFERGKRLGCSYYAEKIEPYLPHESLPAERLPESVCTHTLPDFTEPYFHVYVDTITQYYTKYPHDRQGGVPRILDEMAVPPGTTNIDQIHKKLDAGDGAQ